MPSRVIYKRKFGFGFEALKAIAPEALAFVSSASIPGSNRLALRAIDANSVGVQYGTEEFKQKVYKSHWQVGDRSRWQALKPSMLGEAEGWSQRSKEPPMRMHLSVIFPLFFKFPFLPLYPSPSPSPFSLSFFSLISLGGDEE